MEPIFSRDAAVVGWLKNDVVYDETGYARAYVRNSVVISFDGAFLGRLERGYFWDPDGNAVAFTRDATGAPITPTPRVVPQAPMTVALPNWPSPRVVPQRHEPTQFWSELTWPQYLQLEESAPLS